MHEEQTEAEKQDCQTSDQNQALFTLSSGWVWQERQITQEHVPGLSVNQSRRRFHWNAF